MKHSGTPIPKPGRSKNKKKTPKRKGNFYAHLLKELADTTEVEDAVQCFSTEDNEQIDSSTYSTFEETVGDEEVDDNSYFVIEEIDSNASEETEETEGPDDVFTTSGTKALSEMHGTNSPSLRNVKCTRIDINGATPTSGGCADTRCPQSTEKSRGTVTNSGVWSGDRISVAKHSDIQDSVSSTREARYLDKLKVSECRLMDDKIYVSPERNHAGLSKETPQIKKLAKKPRKISLFRESIYTSSGSSPSKDSNSNEEQNSNRNLQESKNGSLPEREYKITSTISDSLLNTKKSSRKPKIRNRWKESKRKIISSEDSANLSSTNFTEDSDSIRNFIQNEEMPENGDRTQESSKTTTTRELNTENSKKQNMQKQRKNKVQGNRVFLFSDTSRDESRDKPVSQKVKRKKGKSKKGSKNNVASEKSKKRPTSQKRYEIPEDPEVLKKAIEEYKEHLKTLTICPLSLSQLPLLKYDIFI